MEDRSRSESITIAASPEAVYSLVSDVTRMGEWSPICKACWWDDDTRGEGAWFTGRNEVGDRSWETRSMVVVDAPGEEFAFTVGGDRTRWGYTFEAVEGGTLVTESWNFLQPAVDDYLERFGDETEAVIGQRAETATEGMRETLAAIKQVAEAA